MTSVCRIGNKKLINLFWHETGPLITYNVDDNAIAISDLNPETHMRWKMSRMEIFKFGLSCIKASCMWRSTSPTSNLVNTQEIGNPGERPHWATPNPPEQEAVMKRREWETFLRSGPRSGSSLRMAIEVEDEATENDIMEIMEEVTKIMWRRRRAAVAALTNDATYEDVRASGGIGRLTNPPEQKP